MTSDLDIYRTANVLISWPLMRANSFLEVGDMAGSAVWNPPGREIKVIRAYENRKKRLRR